MNIAKNYSAWTAMKNGETKPCSCLPPLSEKDKGLMKSLMVGSSLHWIDSWADGIIKTNFHPAVLRMATPDEIIDATIGWIFNWEITYTFYCKSQLDEWYETEYTYRERNTTIRALTDIINNNVRLPALDKINKLHLYDEGWKATITR